MFTISKSTVVLEDPPVLLRLEDVESNSIVTCTWETGWALHLYWHDEFGSNGVFPKYGFEKLTARDFGLMINGNGQMSKQKFSADCLLKVI